MLTLLDGTFLSRFEHESLGEVGVLFLTAGLKIAAAFLVFFLGRWLVRFGLRRTFTPLIARESDLNPARAARLTTLQTVIRSVMMYALYFVAAIMLLAAVGVNTTSLFATAGVAGVAIGFGSQKIVRDVVTGFLLLLEDQFAVGDVVSIGGNVGVVEETGMRITKLRDESGRLIILSNGDISQVINYSKGSFLVAVDATVAADTPPEKIEAAVQEAAEELQESDAGVSNVRLKGTTAMAAATLTYRVEATARPAHRLDAETALRAALRRALLKNEVQLG
jgi:moderate conductance mechanosensitive channel